MQILVTPNFSGQSNSCIAYSDRITVAREDGVTISYIMRTYGNMPNLDEHFVDPNAFFQNLLHPTPSYTPDIAETTTVSNSTEITRSATGTGTISITAIATYSPIASPSSTASIRPSFTTSLATFSSTPTKLFPNVFPEYKVPITSGGNYSSISENDHYIINTSANVEITCGGGKSQFTLFNNPRAKLIIHNFLPQNGTINLSNIQGISNYDSLNITRGSIIVNLFNDQQIIIKDLYPEDVDEKNFIFPVSSSSITFPPQDSHDESSNLGLIIGVTIGGLIAVSLSAVAFYFVAKHCNAVDNQAVGDNLVAGDLV